MTCGIDRFLEVQRDFAPVSLRVAATASAISGDPSMPIFTASMRTSANRVSICKRTKSAGGKWMPVTCCVFCAVSAATTPEP